MVFALFAGFAGRLLVSDHPQKSDVIVVLAGDSQDERYRHGMELLRAGYGKHLFLDASSDSSYFGHTPAEYADAFLKQDAKDMAAQVSVCPFEDDSTDTETQYVARCLAPLHPASVLLVTSDWHTARAHLRLYRIGCRNTAGPRPQPMTIGSLAPIGGIIANGPKQPFRNGSR